MSKKFTQQEVNAILWGACDTFRKTIDSSVYKDYILVMLFVKYVSDIYKEHYEDLLERYDGDREMADRQIKLDRFHLNEHASFDFLFKNRNATNIGEIINKALADIEEENKTKLRGVFKNIDFNSESVLGKQKEKNAMLKDLLNDFNKLDLRPSRLSNEDIIGNAYEYLISNFASDAGKKGGEFFTPSEVSELLAKLVNPQENDRIYDPTCGSGSLLIKAYNTVPSGKVQIYGQESKGQNHSLARMNMFLHGIDDAKIAWGDTLANPLHLENDKLMKFQAIVANPPFSLDKWASGFDNKSEDKFKMEASLDPYKRFEWGVPPKSKGDYAFIEHMLHSLSENGRMGVVLPHGVLFRGGSEAKIRKQIVDMNLLDAVIGLPQNLFFGTGIPAIILLFKQNRIRNEILFIDASQDNMYEKGKNQNKLRINVDIPRILEAYKKYQNIDKYCYMASKDEIIENEYNLNIPRYVDTFEEEELVDLVEIKKEIIKTQNEIDVIGSKLDEYLRDLGV